MKRFKTVLTLLTVLLLCVMSLPVSASQTVTVTAATVTAKPGDTVTVPVTLSRAENVAAVGVHVKYDGAVLKCNGATLSGAVSEMAMANANTAPVNHPSEVWLTAINGSPITVEGEILLITFTVRANAPQGLTAVEVLQDGLQIIAEPNQTELPTQIVNGGIVVDTGASATAPTNSTTTVASTTTATNTPAPSADKTTDATATKGTSATVSGNDTPATTAPQGDAPSTTAPSEATTIPQGMVTVPNEDGEPITRADGELVTIPSEATAVDINGDVVTGTDGKPSMMQSVAVMVDEVTAAPGETVTVNVSLSAVSELTAIGVSIHYDTEALTFEGGECVGFIKDGMNMSAVTENEEGIVNVSATDPKGVSGSGVIAQLRFTVKANAASGDYRLSLKNTPLLQAGSVELPVQAFAGEIRVEGGADSNSGNALVAVLSVVAAIVVVLILALIVRRKRSAGGKTEAEKPARPTVIDVSGEDEE